MLFSFERMDVLKSTVIWVEGFLCVGPYPCWRRNRHSCECGELRDKGPGTLWFQVMGPRASVRLPREKGLAGAFLGLAGAGSQAEFALDAFMKWGRVVPVAATDKKISKIWLQNFEKLTAFYISGLAWMSLLREDIPDHLIQQPLSPLSTSAFCSISFQELVTIWNRGFLSVGTHRFCSLLSSAPKHTCLM